MPGKLQFAIAVLAWLFAATESRATIFVPVSPDGLARSSPAAVIGTVSDITSVRTDTGEIFTLVTLSVEQVLRGSIAATEITLKEQGGTVGSVHSVFFGNPQYAVGERVLVFLATRPDGSLQTNHLAMGKFRLVKEADGVVMAYRDFDRGTTILRKLDEAPPPAGVPLQTLLDAIYRAAPPSPVPLPSRPPEAQQEWLTRETTSSFSLLATTARLFEPDEGQPLNFVIDSRGDSILGFEASRALIDDAFLAWSDVAGASVSLVDAGLTDNIATPSCPGPHTVRFDDPDGQIPPQVGCSGVLGQGGHCSVDSEAKVFNGVRFSRALRAQLYLADGWEDCEQWTACNVAEIATHELGHALGLGHSSEGFPEPDDVLADATMYFLAHFDGRCAGLRDDDEEGLRFIYPTTQPPTITTPRVLPVAIAGQPYRVEFAATGGTGSFTWQLETATFPGLDLDSAGVLSGTPQAFGNANFRITATDAASDSHTKRFQIEVLEPGSLFGDANCDDYISAADLTALVQLIATGDEPCPRADANGDGHIDADDVETVLSLLFG